MKKQHNENNNLPLKFVVQNDGSQLFKDKVIKYLDKLGPCVLSGNQIGMFYGYDGEKNTVICTEFQHVGMNVKFLKLEDFTELSEPCVPCDDEEEFKRGDWVEVCDDRDEWVTKLFVTEIEGSMFPYVTVTAGYEDSFFNDGQFCHTCYKNIRPINKLEVTMEQIAEKFNVKPEQLQII